MKTKLQNLILDDLELITEDSTYYDFPDNDDSCGLSAVEFISLALIVTILGCALGRFVLWLV